MKQRIAGSKWSLVLVGIPFLFFANLHVTSDEGNEAGGMGIVVGPILIALVGPRRKSM